ncbi:LAFE_0G18118g1_1 [Lachancea fermentati]|uniref:LAFE_0G18118g1_1 n=1 Tax=Lachancea fermentati TaxID=4955 RepID=A0A1G4MIW4_LACFM|nr:LAFE_0G18118g1_1 [Lachancea fermentati]
MPRKKSAAKKAKEAAEKAKVHEEEVNSLKNSTDEKLNRTEGGLEESDADSSSSEEEDDYGELITEEVESGISKVLEAIKANDTDKLLDPSVKFFEEPEKAVKKLARSEKHKPIYLKDYHRMNILSGGVLDDENENAEIETVDGKQSFASQQKMEKAQLLDEIEGEFDDKDDEDDDSDFLVKKEKTNTRRREVTSLPDPEVDDEKFLDEFVSKHAWIPKQGDKIINLDGNQMDEDDDEFDDAVERFENAYNFRYEDPNAAEIVSYARNQATLRRSATNSRRKKREEEKQLREKEKEEKEVAVQKKKKEKINKLTDVLEQVKKEYGAEINEAMVQKLTASLLNGDFDDSQWDNVLGELFNEDFYSQEGKPSWDENDEIMGDFYKEDNFSGNDDAEQLESEEEEPPLKKSRKEKIDEKKSKKKEKKKIAEMVDEAVEKNKLIIVDEVEEERKSRSRTKEEENMRFRYREVSPESFGLTAREIIAADDADLNEFIGLKKFAPYRPKELRAKDRRKVMKSRRVREWKKKVFGNEEGLKGENESLAIPVQNASDMKKGDKKHKKKY